MFLKQLALFLFYFVLLSLGLRFFGYGWESSQFKSAVLGSMFSGFLFLFSYIGWRGILTKKFVALSTMIIVFKYAILVFIVYLFAKQPWGSAIWFIGGIALFKLPLFLWAILLK
jgi:hypothetical protein